MTGKERDILLLIDANSLIHRAFHALPPFRTPNGESSGALYGLASILIKVFKERPPRYVAAAFDYPGPTFREKEYKEYKATRPKAADELISQLIESRTLLEKFGVAVIEKPGWEADDIVATLARRYGGDGVRAVILSGDLDVLQAVDGERILVEVPRKGISDTVVYNEQAVIERFGVAPQKLADFKGLVGDTSDNIPGVPGVGPKTAAGVLRDYASLEAMYEDLHTVGIPNKNLQKKLLAYEKQALLSKKLATLDMNVPVDVDLHDLEVKAPLADKELVRYLRQLGFESLAQRCIASREKG